VERRRKTEEEVEPIKGREDESFLLFGILWREKEENRRGRGSGEEDEKIRRKVKGEITK
jgi:hypothetical protein